VKASANLRKRTRFHAKSSEYRKVFGRFVAFVPEIFTSAGVRMSPQPERERR
jgi:hypothetical protein